MVQRDIILEQIHQLGQMMGKILAKLIGTETMETLAATEVAIKKRLAEELAIDVEEVLRGDLDAVQDHLVEKGLTADHFDRLAEHYAIVGRMKQAQQTEGSLESFALAMRFLTLAERTSDTVTFERIGLKGELGGCWGSGLHCLVKTGNGTSGPKFTNAKPPGGHNDHGHLEHTGAFVTLNFNSI